MYQKLHLQTYCTTANPELSQTSSRVLLDVGAVKLLPVQYCPQLISSIFVHRCHTRRTAHRYCSHHMQWLITQRRVLAEHVLVSYDCSCMLWVGLPSGVYQPHLTRSRADPVGCWRNTGSGVHVQLVCRAWAVFGMPAEVLPLLESKTLTLEAVEHLADKGWCCCHSFQSSVGHVHSHDAALCHHTDCDWS